MAVQLERMERPARPGVAFPLVKKLLTFNADGQHRVEVVILSRNDPVSGLRVFRSAKEEGLALERGVFTQEISLVRWMGPVLPAECDRLYRRVQELEGRLSVG